MKRWAVYLGGFVVVAVLAGLAFIYSGIFNVSAIRQHTPLVFWALTKTMVESVQARSPEVPMPDLSDPELIAQGIRHYERHCAQCHGAPGIAPDDLAKGMRPVPPNLVHAARSWETGDIFWAIKHGVAMTGMPAWAYRMDDSGIWAVVAVVKLLAVVSPAEYQAMRDEAIPDPQPSLEESAMAETPAPTGGADAGEAAVEEPDPEQGRIAILQYGCISCHKVADVVGPDVRVGPRLEGLSDREFIAGVLPNTPENLVRWIRRPQEIDPLTAMPDMGVSEAHARDIAAYLYEQN